MNELRLRVPVRLGADAYPILIRTAGESLVGSWLAREERPWVVITDTRVRRHVWVRLARALRERGLAVPEPIVIPCGERHKNPRRLAAVLREMLRRGMDRTGLVVAVGGGVVTDLAGFAAATYMRGIGWVAVPTTLLGMVDAAIGGKVGANLLRTKNAIGAFHQPRAVLIGTDFLRSLPERQRRNGLGEVVKYAMIADRRLFLDLERGRPDLLGRHPAADARLVARCCRIKARIVEADVREQGVRAALNFGHTLGHALEGDGRSGLAHGEAVGLGMLVACALAEELGVAREPLRERLQALLQRLGLPVRARRRTSLGTLRRAWRRDKKALQGLPRFVLTPRIGTVSMGHRIDEEHLERSLSVVLQSVPSRSSS